jgi:membrane fusion protein (multidrug efflux system)
MSTAKRPKRRRALPPAEEAPSERKAPSAAGSGAVVKRLMSGLEPGLPAAARFAGTYRHWLLAALVLALIAAPIASWLYYEAAHVTSSNAAVRGHLAEIGVRANGLVASFGVDAGERVQEGHVLARLEDSHYRAEVQEATAYLDGLTRELEVERMMIAHERRRIEQQREEATANMDAAAAQAKAAEIRLENAGKTYELRQSLHEKSRAISGEDVRDALNDVRTAEAQLNEAHAEHIAARSARDRVLLDKDELTIRERRVGVLEADVARARALLARAEADLAGAVVRAPEDGAVVRRIAQPGTSVNVGQPIVSMLLGDDVWIEAWIDENDIGAVGVGNRATVTLHSFPDREFSGRVERIGLITDFEIPSSEVPQPRESRMHGAPVVGVRIVLDEPPPNLLPGASAVVAIRKSAEPAGNELDHDVDKLANGR